MIACRLSKLAKSTLVFHQINQVITFVFQEKERGNDHERRETYTRKSSKSENKKIIRYILFFLHESRNE